MRVLVTGSHGLIGRALIARLEAGGHEVVRLVRPGVPGEVVRSGVSWDPMRGRVDQSALRRAGPFYGVVHLAGAGIGDRRWTPARRREILDSRVRSTTGLATALAELPDPPEVLVSASAVGYYGDRGDELLDETSGPGRGFLADLCQQWEQATAPADDRSRVVHLRSGIVLSPEGGALGRQLPLFRLGLGGRLGHGRQYVSWITLEDEVGLVEFALTNEIHGPMNATAPEPVTNAEFTAALGHALGRPTFLSVPRPALSLVLGSELVDEALLASQRAVPAAALAGGFRFRQPTVGPALGHLLARR